MSKVSKNAREGRKAEDTRKRCAEGHLLERVKVVPVFGRAKLLWRCECA